MKNRFISTLFHFILILVLILPYSLHADLPSCDPFQEFPPESKAEKELAEILRKPDREVNLALVNYLIAKDLPKFRDISRREYFDMLSKRLNSVVKDLVTIQDNPETKDLLRNPMNVAYLLSSGLIKSGIGYSKTFAKAELTGEEIKELYKNEENLFLTGLLATGEGSCTSMPMLYTAIAQSLNMPVRLVHVGKHYFVRWDEAKAVFNMEPTSISKVFIGIKDSEYLKIENLSFGEIAGTSQLRSLNNHEAVSALFYIRSGYYIAHGPKYKREAVRDLKRAYCLNPKNTNILKSLEIQNKRRKDQSFANFPNGIPDFHGKNNHPTSSQKRERFPLPPGYVDKSVTPSTKIKTQSVILNHLPSESATISPIGINTSKDSNCVVMCLN